MPSLRGYIDPTPWRAALTFPYAVSSQVRRLPPSSVVILILVVLRDILCVVRLMLVIPSVGIGRGEKENAVMHCAVPLCTAMCAGSLPDNLILKVVLPEYLIQHHLHIVARVPVAVIVKTPRLLQHPRQFHAPRPHVVDVRLRARVPILERPLFLRLTPEHLIVPVRVEGRVDVDQVHAGVGQFGELFEVVAAVDDTGVDEF